MIQEEFEILKQNQSYKKNSIRKFGTDLTNNHTISSPNMPKKNKFQGVPQEVYSEMSKILYEIEKENIPSSDYMSTQSDINSNMRAILIDWLIYIQYKLKYSSETLMLTVNLIDRYLEKVQVNRRYLQLVGISSMLIACKYEEINIPKIKDLIYITDNAYNKHQVLDMENNILNVLEFNITFTSPLRFIERFVSEFRMTHKEGVASRYVLELVMLDYKFIRIKPSVLAAACCLLAGFDERRSFEFGICEQRLKEVTRELAKAVEALRGCSLQAIRTKYSSSENCEIAKTYRLPCFIEELYKKT